MKGGVVLREKWYDILIESFNYLVLQYVLGCATFANRGSLLYVVFFASGVFYTTKFITFLRQAFTHKAWGYILFASNIVILILLFNNFGAVLK